MKTIIHDSISDDEMSEIKRRFSKKYKVDNLSNCWIWTGAKSKKGYGMFSIGPSRTPCGKRRNSMHTAPRVSYEIHVGRIPEMEGHHGACVLHVCDNPSCVNPSHLFIGSNIDNVRDMDRKKRRVTVAAKGSDHKNSKINESMVNEIVNLINLGVPQGEISKKYSISKSTVSAIKTGRIWSHFTGIKKL